MLSDDKIQTEKKTLTTMEPFSQELLTILTLIAVILAGVTFLAVLILIICILCVKSHQSNTISPIDTRSIASSDTRSSSVSHTPTKSPVVTSTKRKKQSDSISIIYERPYNHQYDKTTRTNESRIQRPQQRQQRFTPITDVRFLDRHTPYPSDVLARERNMMNHRQFPMNNDDN
jgi:hypothetical protein